MVSASKDYLARIFWRFVAIGVGIQAAFLVVMALMEPPSLEAFLAMATSSMAFVQFGVLMAPAAVIGVLWLMASYSPSDTAQTHP
jgi:hypothetical protein